MEDLELIYVGKTKDVYRRKDGLLEFHFKDDATGYIDLITKQPVFNSGYDEVVGKIRGKAIISCQFTKFFYDIFESKLIPTHLVEIKPHSNIMVAKPAKLLNVPNQAKDFVGSADVYHLEWVFRNEVFGSQWRRYPCMIPGRRLNTPVEIYTKGKAGEPDILIADDMLSELGIMTPEELKTIKERTKQIAKIMSEEFVKRNLHLIDGKMEWGRRVDTNEIILIDDLSPDTFRVCEGYVLDEKGNCKINTQCITTNVKDGKRTIEAKNILSADPLGLNKLANVFELKK